ncbi:MAG: hypothetical protein Q8K75_02920 [Chlamydiales bacterium]|nr:hypothetical protein [Chlamydiales bacterium]
MKGISGFALLGTAVFMSLTASAGMLFAENNSKADKEPVVAKEGVSVEECRKALVNEPFPELIVENVLVEKGIPKSQIKEINGKLQGRVHHQASREEVREVIEETEPVATNDPLSGAYDAEGMADIQFDLFVDVMKEYITDADLARAMYTDISAKRKAQIEACGQESAKHDK